MQIIGQITPGDYWEWRTTIEEQKNAKLQMDVVTLKLQLMEKEIELLRLRAAIFKNTEVEHKKEMIKARDKDYEGIKARIEQSVGVELKDCMIDEITYEIKKLDPDA